jgi:hypothetical protein
MPSPSAFLRGFGLTKGYEIADYTLSEIHIEHQEVQRYREYVYPITLTFTGGNDVNSLKRMLQNQLGKSKIINSAYGNPYECNIGNLNFSQRGQDVIVSATGHGYRV